MFFILEWRMIMKFLEVLQKVQKVYDSCETIQQINTGKKYTMLLVQHWCKIAYKSAISVEEQIQCNRNAVTLAKYTKFLREKNVLELTKKENMSTLPELEYNHPV